MSNPTTPFSWQMPTSTDLVTDLPADFEVFGQAVATSMADLLGGTTGQILSKTSNTDMDFTWIANDQGDITGVTATSPLTGGGTSGAITVGILSGTTSNLGAVQLSTSTSSTSTSLAATASAVKSAYDLADAAIPKSTATAKGNVFTATAASTPAVLAVGTNGQILTADSTAATGLKWATGTTSKFVLLNQTTMSAVSSQVIDSIFSSSYNSYIVVMDNFTVAAGSSSVTMQLMYSGTAQTGEYYQGGGSIAYNGSSVGFNNVANGSGWNPIINAGTSTAITSQGIVKIVYNGGSSVGPVMDFQSWNGYNTAANWGGGIMHTARTYTGVKFIPVSSTLSGRISIYGLAN